MKLYTLTCVHTPDERGATGFISDIRMYKTYEEALAALTEETEREWRKPVFYKIHERPDFGPHEDMVGRSVASWDYQEGFGDGYNEWEIHVFDVPED